MNDKDIPYFKIKYAMLSTWTLEQAAYLLSGFNPLDCKFKIGKDKTNKVSNLYYFLSRKKYEKALHFVKRETIIPNDGKKNFLKRKHAFYYNVDQFFECLDKDGREYDEELYEARQYFFSKKYNPRITGKINRVIYRHAAKIIWETQSELPAPTVSEFLKSLPEHLEKKYEFQFPLLQASQIQEHLKSGISPRKKGAPKKETMRDVIVEWSYVIEKM